MRLMVWHIWVVMSHVHWVELIISIVTWFMLEWRHLTVRMVILVDWVVMSTVMRFSWFRESIKVRRSRSSVRWWQIGSRVSRRWLVGCPAGAW